MKVNNQIVSEVTEINIEVCRRLWRMASTKSKPSVLAPRLICPEYRSELRRVSEQEARFVYAEFLASTNYYYSVETPTEELYCFKGDGEHKRSAQSDMSLYHYNESAGMEKIVNVELKAGNPVESACEKDIEKLIREAPCGNWFHIFGNADTATVPTLLDKFGKCFKTHNGICQQNNVSIVFCLCVMDKKWACIKHFQFPCADKSFDEYVESFFRIDYSATRDKLEVKNPNGWLIVESGIELPIRQISSLI